MAPYTPITTVDLYQASLLLLRACGPQTNCTSFLTIVASSIGLGGVALLFSINAPSNEKVKVAESYSRSKLSYKESNVMLPLVNHRISDVMQLFLLCL